MSINLRHYLRGGLTMVALSALLSVASLSPVAYAQDPTKSVSVTGTTDSLSESDLRGAPVDTKEVVDKAKLFRKLPNGTPVQITPMDVTQPGKPAVDPKAAPKTTPTVDPKTTPTVDPKATPAVDPNAPATAPATTPGTAPGTAPGTTTVTTPTAPSPGVLTPSGMPTAEDIQKMIKMRQEQMRDPAKQPSPEVLEKIYRDVWTQIGAKYYDQGKLKDWHLWADKYKGKLKTGEDLQNALKAMVASVGDRWTKFTTVDDMFASMARSASGIVHLGVGLARQADGTYKIEMILYGTPAWEGNRLRTGDVVKSIVVNSTSSDGKATSTTTDLAGLTKDQADALTFAKKGSEAVLTIVHDGIEEQVKVAFGVAPEAQIDVRMLPGNIGYIRLPSFGSSPGDLEALSQGMVEALFALDQNANGGMRGLVLDLRNNGGGIVDVAQNIASLFIREGIFLKTHESNGRFSEDKTTYINRPLPYNYVGMPPEMAAIIERLLEVPLTVLVNGSSASSSEILTGTLKDNKRAIIIGTQTFGKAVAYTDEQVKPLGELQITVMHYLTPSGYDLANKGIEPDLVIDRSRGGSIDEQLAAAVTVINQMANAKFSGPAGTPPAHNGDDDFGGTSVLMIGIGLGAGLVGLFLIRLHGRKRRERDQAEKEDRKNNRQ
ncbi:MAG: S41 family peptidase [Candidatus Obscuribacterales bacterium]